MVCFLNFLKTRNIFHSRHNIIVKYDIPEYYKNTTGNYMKNITQIAEYILRLWGFLEN